MDISGSALVADGLSEALAEALSEALVDDAETLSAAFDAVADAEEVADFVVVVSSAAASVGDHVRVSGLFKQAWTQLTKSLPL